MLTIKQLDTRLVELGQQEATALINAEVAVFSWLCELRDVLENIAATSLNTEDRIARLNTLSKQIGAR